MPIDRFGRQIAQQSGEKRELLVVEFDHVGEPERFQHHFAVAEGRAQIEVEDPERLFPGMAQKGADCFRRTAPLGEGAEADRVEGRGEFRRPADVVPGGIRREGAGGFSVRVERDADLAGGAA